MRTFIIHKHFLYFFCKNVCKYTLLLIRCNTANYIFIKKVINKKKLSWNIKKTSNPY